MRTMPKFPDKEIKPIPPIPEYPRAFLNQKYMLPEDKIHEVYDDGNVIGIECSILLPAYHGYPLSMIDHIVARYDQAEFINDPMTLTVGGHTYTFKQMKTMSTIFWEYGEYAKLFIPIPGGVGLGVHKLQVGIAINGGIARPASPGWATAIINFIEN